MDFSTMSNEGIELHTVLGVKDDPITKRDLAEVRQIIAEWYEPMSDAGFKVFALAIARKGWGKTKLLDAVYTFLDRKYPRWTPGDFFGMEPRLYPLSWYRERLRENPENGMKIGWYRVEGCATPLCGWKQEIGSALPLWEFPKVVPAPVRSAREKEYMSRAMPVEVELVRRLFLAEYRIGILEQEEIHLREELIAAQQAITDQAVIIADLKQELAHYQSGDP